MGMIETGDFVTVPRAEYTELTRARMGIELISTTKSKYGYDTSLINTVMSALGFNQEDAPDAE